MRAGPGKTGRMTTHRSAPHSGTQSERLDALLRAARAGEGRASCRLGDLYRQGEAVEQDWDEAFRWYSLGASQGDAHAQNNLATLFLHGIGCLPEETRAVFWYRKSAAQGHATAQANLGKRYLRGEGVAPDPLEAFRWFEAASRQGDLGGMWELAMMVRFGRGVARDLLAAVQLCLAAARGGLVAAEVTLGDCLDELQDLALAGDATASRYLCEMHHLGLGVAPVPPLTWTWIRWAKVHCRPAADPDRAAEIESTFAFYEQWLSAEIRAEGERVLAALLRPLPGIPPRRAGSRERPPPRVRYKRRSRS